MKTGIANLPLHNGKTPRWLFERMTRLAREIIIIIVRDYGPEEILKRLSDPYWFQSFGCLLGFDWHSSGVTTTVCGAVKAGVKGIEKDLGFFATGGKGGVSRRTPSEIESRGGFLSVHPSELIYASKTSAKVDSAALQDGYQLYHHAFFFVKNGKWAVVQQGMNEASRYARRYHWLGEGVKDFVCEPHNAVCCDAKGVVLNMVASESSRAREASAKISHDKPETLIREIKRLQTLNMPVRHHMLIKDINPDRLYRILLSTYERQPEDFESLIGMEGVGLKTIRALSLISELVYGAKASHQDPARYSFAHGGKDGYPYPVDRIAYDNSIGFLRKIVNLTRLGRYEKLDTFKRLDRMTGRFSCKLRS